MYLTKMPINRRRRAAGKLLSYPEAMHAAVESAFAPGSLTNADGRVLWRIDNPLPDETNLYIVSPVEPDLSHLVEQAGWQTGEMWQTRDYTLFLNSLQVGQRCGFRLRANPVFHRRKEPDKPTRPFAHVSVKLQEQWLLDRAERHGFIIPDDPGMGVCLRTVERGKMRFGKNDGHNVTLGYATFDGIIEITDADALRGALTRGIGRAKAYGCGLMTLAPIPPSGT